MNSARDTITSQPIQAYDGLPHSTPGWVNELSSRFFKNQLSSFVGLQIRDYGNPFVSRQNDKSSRAIDSWKPRKGVVDGSAGMANPISNVMSFKDLLEFFPGAAKQESQCTYALNLWACRRAADALEESLRYARDRLTQFGLARDTSGEISVAKRSSILRSHRQILSRTFQKINENVDQLSPLVKASQRNYLSLTHVSTENTSEASTIIDHLTKLQKEATELMELNERLLADCLFDLQIELTETQLLESRKSMEQDASIARLQILAFIFIPISTVASVFGMNVNGFTNIDIRLFIIATILVLALSLVIAAFNSIRAIFSAIEAAAYSWTKWPDMDRHLYAAGYTSYWRAVTFGRYWKRGALFKVVRVIGSRVCVGMFALVALALTPCEMLWYQLFRCIDYGARQEKLHRVRRLRVSDRRAREIVVSSVRAWVKHTTKLSWVLEKLSFALFPFMFIWAYVRYRVYQA